MHVNRCGIAIVLLLFLVACNTKAPPNVLIQFDGAKDVNSYSLNGMDVLEYHLNEKYPPDSKIAEVTKRLGEKGWKPLEYSWLSPAYKSSHSQGWTVFRDPPNYPEWLIYEWQGDWQDPHGNIVTYTLRYQESVEKLNRSMFVLKPGNSDLRITALYMPAKEAKHRQEQINPPH